MSGARSTRAVALQPDNIAAQTEGSTIYGLGGLALTERISIKDGAVEQSNFYDYIVSRNSDAPPMHVEVIQTDNHPTGCGQMSDADRGAACQFRMRWRNSPACACGARRLPRSG